MRRVIASTMVTLDGVMEAPDRGAFRFLNEELDRLALDELLASDALLLGRATTAERVSELKRQPGGDVLVLASADLVRTLTRHDLIDEYRLRVAPVVVGSGKRLFEDGGDRKALELVDSRTFGTGVVYLAYGPAGG